jgi:MFS family permease
MYMGSIGIALAVIIYFIVKDCPNDKPNQKKFSQKASKDLNLKDGLFSILKNKQLWLTACYGGLIYMCTPVFCGLWGVPFLMLKLNLDKASAANSISLVFVGWAIASPLWGIFTNFIGRRKPALYLSAIGALSCLILTIYVPASKLTTEVILFIFGIFSAGFLPAFSIARDMCQEKYVATGLSFMNMMNMIGIALAQPLIGYFLDMLWQGQIENGVRIYSLVAYQKSLMILPLSVGIALLIVPFIQEINMHGRAKK